MSTPTEADIPPESLTCERHRYSQCEGQVDRLCVDCGLTTEQGCPGTDMQEVFRKDIRYAHLEVEDLCQGHQKTYGQGMYTPSGTGWA